MKNIDFFGVESFDIEINRVEMKLLITAEMEEINNEQKASYGNFI